MTDIRHNWQAGEVEKLYNLSLMDLLFQAQTIHRRYFNPNELQLSTLLSIKTGSCPEDCAFCPQSAHYDTGLQRQSLMPLEEVLTVAKEAKANGATRFCMGAAWRNPPKKDFPKVVEMIKEVKKLGLQTCATLGMLDNEQAMELKKADLDFYNHNLETSPEFYEKIVTTARTYQARLDTLQRVRQVGIKVCCGGILGMGETRQDRIGLLLQLANLPEHPESVPINYLLNIAGTPLEKIAEEDSIDLLEYLRTIAIARIMMPRAYVRLSCGRQNMDESMQILCFFAGANSFFYGDKLLTRPNCKPEDDTNLLKRLGMKII